MRLGVIGYNEGNGHPFSFSAIVNGYSDEGFAVAGWPAIHDYLRERDVSDFGFAGVAVSHAWTPDATITQKLCRASRIDHAVARPEDMIGAVDGVLICRHDHESHLPLARPFLEAGLPVFVDKPLALDPAALRELLPYVAAGRLMSCSGLRYARELDRPVAELPSYGTIRLVRAAVVLDWEKYGIHMIDVALRLGWANPLAIARLPAAHESFAIEMDDGSLLQIDALGTAPRTFRLDIVGTERASHHDLFDNFSAFRRTLHHFIEMARTRRPPVPVETVTTSMRLLIAGALSDRERRRVALTEIAIQ